MTRPRGGGHRFLALAFIALLLACGEASTAPNDAQETVLVSLVGLDGTDAGVVLQLVGAADQIEPASAEFEVAWVTDATEAATVAIVGPLSDGADLLVVRRRVGVGPLRAEVRETARADGTLSTASSARAILHRGVDP